MPNPLARLFAPTRRTFRGPIATRAERAAVTDALAARLGIVSTDYDRALCTARLDRVGLYLAPAVALAGGYLTSYADLFDASGKTVDPHSRHSGVPAIATFPIHLAGETIGHVTLGALLGSEPLVGVEIDGEPLPPVPLLDDSALFESAVRLGERVRAVASR
jgi:hypothetical protein